MSNEAFLEVTNLLDAIAPDESRRGARYEIAGGTLDVFGSGHGVARWVYDGGAGGVHTGVWDSVEDAKDWLEANADAID